MSQFEIEVESQSFAQHTCHILREAGFNDVRWNKSNFGCSVFVIGEGIDEFIFSKFPSIVTEEFTADAKIQLMGNNKVRIIT